MQIETASTHDLAAMKPVLQTTQNATIVLDKAYCDEQLRQDLEQNNNVCLFTPEKMKRGESVEQRQDRQAFRDLLNTAVAKLRQPIESLFAWLDRKTALQNATIVRSEKGLLLHVFGKVKAAFMSLNPV